MKIIAYTGNDASDAMLKMVDYFRSLRHTVVERNPIYFDADTFDKATGANFVLVDTGLANKEAITAAYTILEVTVLDVVKSDSDELTAANAAVADYSVTALTVPGAGTMTGCSAGKLSALVSFTAPTDKGGAQDLVYTVTSDPAGGVDSKTGTDFTGRVITGLTAETPYTFTVKATNCVGEGAASEASAPVTPYA